MKQQFIISAVGPNITGVVARISREIHACGCNFEDSGMKVLGVLEYMKNEVYDHMAGYLSGEYQDNGDEFED